VGPFVQEDVTLSASAVQSIPSLSSQARRRRRIFDLVGAVVVLSWLIALGLRLIGPAPDSVEQGLRREAAAGLQPGDEWHGLYREGQWVGYLHLRKDRLAAPSGGYRVASDLRLDLLVLGVQQRLDVELQAELDEQLQLRRFEARLRGGNAGDFQVDGEVAGLELRLRFHSAGATTTRTLTLATPPTLELAARPLLAQQGLAVGRKLQIEFFDPLGGTQRRLEATVVREEELQVLGEPVRCFVLEQELDGLKLKAWVTAGGDVVREELPLGVVARRETEEEARYGPRGASGSGLPADRAAPVAPSPDLVDAQSVPRRGDPRLLQGEVVRLRLVGLSATDPELSRTLDLDGGRQRWTGEELVLTREPPVVVPPAGAAPLPAAVAPYLRAEPLIQSDHPALRTAAAEALQGAVAPPVQAERLVRWVWERLAKEGVVGIPSALDVLRNRRGDCNEHTILFVALARAAGLPARILAGLFYLPERERFYYHAWAEVWLGERWVEVDPTFGEVPASLGRVRIIRGGLDRQVELFRVIGRLQAIEGLPPVAASQEVVP